MKTQLTKARTSRLLEATGSATPDEHWACACVKRHPDGKLKAIKLHPLSVKSCRVCGAKRDASACVSPWREVERLCTAYNELLYAVASKHEGETRHETALRYIRERENRTEGPCVDSPNTKLTDRDKTGGTT